MDKGWAWVVLFACFVNFYLSGWFAYTVGVVHVALLDTYDDDVATTSWVGALHSSMVCLTGPVAGMIISRYNCRICTLIGACFILTGFTISAYVKGIRVLLLTYGFIAGMGTGMCYCAGVVSLGYNFKKYLGVTNGVSMAGAALGIFSGGPVSRYFLDHYGLGGAFLLMGGVGSNMFVCGMLLRPTTFEKNLKRERELQRAIAKEEGTLSIRKSLRDAWSRYAHVLQNKAFTFYNISIFTWHIAQSAIYLHLPFYAESKGTSPDKAAALFTGMGVFSLVSRLLTGLVVTKQKEDGLLLHMGTLGMVAISTILFPLYSSTYVGQMVYACLIGLYFGTPIVLLNPLTVELVGLDHLATAFGLGTFVLGSGYLIGPPLVGFLVDHGASYDVSFYVAGGLILLSSLVSLGTGLIHGKSKLSVDPSLFSSLSVMPPELASTISLRTKGLLNGSKPCLTSESKEKVELIDDVDKLVEILNGDGVRFTKDAQENESLKLDSQRKDNCDSEEKSLDIGKSLLSCDKISEKVIQ